MSPPRRLADFWYDALSAAPRLIGSSIVRVRATPAGGWEIRRARIVETEAYLQEDPASHSFPGPTGRNRSMFGPPCRAYVYRIHRVVCFNVVTGPVGRGEAVLIRAVEPECGLDLMERSRAAHTTGRLAPRGHALTNGPGKLCQALEITLDDDGADLRPPPREGHGRDAPRPPGPGIYLDLARPLARSRIEATRRIGIARGRESLYRFVESGNPWVGAGPTARTSAGRGPRGSPHTESAGTRRSSSRDRSVRAAAGRFRGVD